MRKNLFSKMLTGKKALSAVLAAVIAMGMSGCSAEGNNHGKYDNPENVTGDTIEIEKLEYGEEDIMELEKLNLAASVKDEERNEVVFAYDGRMNIEHEENQELIYDEDIDQLDRAALKLLNQCIKAEGEGANILISPVSVEMAFGLLENGAGGKTLSEIEAVIGGGLPVDRQNLAMLYLADSLENAEYVNWNVANSIWLNTENGDVILRDDYISNVKKYYDAEMYALPFNEEAGRLINSWVNEETKGMIPAIVNGAPFGSMRLINAVAFEGEWADEYEDADISEDSIFTNYDDTDSKVNMLSSEESRWFRLGDGIGFAKLYKGLRYSFVGILPPEGVSTADYIQSIVDGDISFSESYRDSEYGDVYVTMPEFKTEYSKELSGELKKLGMNNAFSEAADFSGMKDEGSLIISAVNHKTFIEVDRKGTRAAAITDIVLTEAAAMIDESIVIELDRPFVYAIVDERTGLPIFIGVENHM